MRSPFSVTPPALVAASERSLYNHGHAAGLLYKAAGDATSIYALSGRLKLSQSGWLLLEVPNALVHGLFAALDLPGAELPPGKPNFEAHISVARPEELEKVTGGASAISERGKRFRWQLGPIKEVEPAGWSEMSKVYFASVTSPELQTLRKSYGLSPLPQVGGKTIGFHLTCGVRKKSVLHDNEVSKAAEARGPEGEHCPHCDARLERGDDGRRNRCGQPWPEKRADLRGALAGAGVLGAGNVLLDRALHRKEERNPLRAGIDGMLLGGLAGHLVGGSAAPAAPRPSLPQYKTPVVEGQRALSDQIAGHYQNAPGGFPGALGRALAARKPLPGLSLGFTAGDVHRPMDVQLTGNFPEGLLGRINDRPAGPSVRIDAGASPRQQAQTLEHELTHGALDFLPYRRGAGEVLGAGNEGDFHDYSSSPKELLPRVADIKRQYVRAHPGADVNTPEQADRALGWWRKRMRDPAFRGAADQSHVESWDSWQEHEPAGSPFWEQVRRLMPQLVGVARGDARKVASDGGGAVLGLLRKAKERSDARDYKQKHALLRRAIAARPEEFYEDSRHGGIVGITHRPSGFRIHALAARVPALGGPRGPVSLGT